MGPNGSGKSTLANAIMGHPNLEVTEGQILFDGEDITEADPDERARVGLFMAFQYPVAIPGVTVTKYLRMVMNAHREARGEGDVPLQRVPQDRRGGDGAHERPEGVLLALPQRGLLRRREEAHGDPPARAPEAEARGPRRDRLGPGHRRAERRRARRQHRRQGHRHGRPDHHPLPAHPAPRATPTRVSIMFDGRIVKEGGPELVERLEAEGYAQHPRGGSARRSHDRSPRPAAPIWHGEFPSLAARGHRLPRHRRHVADAAVGHRRDGRLLRAPSRDACTAACTRSRSRRRTCSRARATASRRAWAGPRATRSSRRTRRRRSTSSRTLGPRERRARGPRRRDARWSTTRTSCRGTCSARETGATLEVVAVDDDGLLRLDELDALLATRHGEGRRRRARLQRRSARSTRSRRSSRRAHAAGAVVGRRRLAGRAADPGRRRRSSTPTSTPGPGTRPTARPASASCTAAASCSTRCRRSSAAGT